MMCRQKLVQKINQKVFISFLAKEFFETKIGVRINVLCHFYCLSLFTKIRKNKKASREKLALVGFSLK
jgi:hypothetical protein